MNPVTTAEHQKEQELPRATKAELDHGRDRGVEDEEMAGRSSATLLITASTRGEVETVARRIHRTSFRATAPFVRVRTGTLPIEPRMLRETCSALLDAAPGGSMLMTDVEEMPASVQGVLADLLAELQSARARSAAVRLISGTTVPLLDRIAAGTFSERLFYRLNLLHLVAETVLRKPRRDRGRPSKLSNDAHKRNSICAV
jgi:DNA-binding NtrC family response regulator